MGKCVTYYIFQALITTMLSLLTMFGLPAQTIIQVSGEIEGEVQWTSNNTYIVVGDIIVQNNARLIIEGGTHIRFEQGKAIIVNGGYFIAGASTPDNGDTVHFRPNYSHPNQNFRWRGISIQNVQEPEQVQLNKVRISRAEIGVEIINSTNILINRSSLLDNLWRGISIINSSDVSITGCILSGNYVGIEVIARGKDGLSENNTIVNNFISSINSNIHFLTEHNGKYADNLISHNKIYKGLNGIWLENNGSPLSAINTIESNVFYAIGEMVGYALYLAIDNATINDNIFWSNNLAIFSRQQGGNIITGNSFYQNKWAVLLNASTNPDQIKNNTFTLNEKSLLIIQNAQHLIFENNNLMYTEGSKYIIENNTGFDFNIQNNYWGTTITDHINGLIFDGLENPELGIMSYLPTLNQPDTSNPVAPPLKAIKQWNGQRVVVRWEPNVEENIAGYRIHYGGFANYSFAESETFTNNTLLELPDDISIYDTVAVTAFNTNAIFPEAQFNGHESPFAFAELYPYAGRDTIVCNDIFEFVNPHVQVPFVYQKLFWTSSGDGTFINPSSINGIYRPGFNDSINGFAWLFINVVLDSDTLVDGFKLTLAPRPVVFAGNDTIVNAENGIELSWAYALDANSVLWTTAGDGTFENDTVVNTTYFPGISDFTDGSTYLYLSALGQCDGLVSDSVLLIFGPFYNVQGKVWADDNVVTNGVVLAIEANESSSQNVYITPISRLGLFTFELMVPGSYYLYAVPDTNLSYQALPAYYTGNLSWTTAYELEVFANIIDIDVRLPIVSNPLIEGNGKISGNLSGNIPVHNDASIYCRSWFEEGMPPELCDDGLSNMTVLLYNSLGVVVLDFSLTDQFGSFVFDSLPFGTYVVGAEKAGYHVTASPPLLINPTNPQVENLVIGFSGKNISIYTLDDKHGSGQAIVTVYPNPARHIIQLHVAKLAPGSYGLRLFSAQGLEVFNKSLHTKLSQTGIYENINIENLPNGAYFGTLSGHNQSIPFTFIKW